MKVVILAAGKGTRMEGNPDNFSKCVTRISHTLGPYDTPITRLMSQVDNPGQIGLSFIVVGGYGIESVSNTIKDYIDNPCHLIYNNRYETRGCNYSLSTVASLLNDNEDVLILEGDSIYKEEILSNFIRQSSLFKESACLVRSKNYLNDNSVCVMADEVTDHVIRYIYDKDHKLTTYLDCIAKFEGVSLYESMQAWLIKSKDVKYLKSRLFDYFVEVPFSSDESKNHSGVYSLNQTISDGVTIRPILCKSTLSQYWINLNTQEDLDKVKNLTLKGEL